MSRTLRDALFDLADLCWCQCAVVRFILGQHFRRQRVERLMYRLGFVHAKAFRKTLRRLAGNARSAINSAIAERNLGDRIAC